MRVQYDVMVQEFARVLEKKGFRREDAESAAVIFAQNSLAGVFSHGLNRFPRVVSYLEKGEIDLEGRIDSIQYSEVSDFKKGGETLLNRLFR